MSLPPGFPFVFVTGNAHKVAEVARITGGEVRSVAIDLPEIQSLDLREVLSAKAAEAFRRLQSPVVVEDVSLEIRAFGGFPGPLVKWMLEALGAEGLARAARAADRDAGWPDDTLGAVTARCGLLYLDEGGEVFAEGVVEGHLIAPPRGDRGFGFDPIFQPLGSPHTFAEFSDAHKDLTGHRGLAWRALLGRLDLG